MAERPTPPRDEIISELRTVRERGLGRISESSLPALEACCALIGIEIPEGDGARTAAGVEELLRRAVKRLGGDKTGLAAAYTFGLVPGSKFWTPAERRGAAAKSQYVSVERFRKKHEPELIGYVADEVLLLCSAARLQTRPNPIQPGDPPILDGLARGLLLQLGRRRTAYPLDMSLEELVDSEILVPPRVARHIPRERSNSQSAEVLVSELAAGRSSLLLGEPGAGKTVTLYWVAAECMRRGLIPVVLRAQEAMGMLGTDEWARAKQEAPSQIVILVDGLDEALFAWAAEGIPDQLISEISAVPCLVTSRTRDFEQSAVLNRAEVVFDSVFNLQDWSIEGEFKEYLDRLSRAGLIEDPRLYHTVVASEALTRLAQRPLYARMLTFVGGASAATLRDPNSLYSEYIARLARVAETVLERRQCRLPTTVLDVWKNLAWDVHNSGGPSSFDFSRYRALLRGDSRCVRVAIGQVVDFRETRGQEIGEFIHYSFYEHLLANYVYEELTRAADASSMLAVLRMDLSREVRHFLVAQIRLRNDRSLTQGMKAAFLQASQHQLPERDRLSALNLLTYLLSRAFDDSIPVLESILADENDDFLQISLLWALCHLGSDRALLQYYERLESLESWRSLSRGYSLYYYGDLNQEDGPPYFDNHPYLPYANTRRGLSQLIMDPTYSDLVKPQRQFIDIYVLLDIVRVRSETMDPDLAETVGSLLRGPNLGALPTQLSTRLGEMLAEVIQ